MSEKSERRTDPLPDGGPFLWNDEAFRKRVRRLAENQGRSVTEIFVTAGISKNYLSRPPSINGRSVEVMAKLARELDVSLADLVDFEDHPNATAVLNRLMFTLELAVNAYNIMAIRRITPVSADIPRLVGKILREIGNPD